MKLPFVYVRFPKSGLGNMLQVWARGYVFASINHLPVVCSRRGGFRWGALLRREKQSRLYFGYFKENKFSEINAAERLLRAGKVEKEPELKTFPETDLQERMFVFENLVPDQNFFLGFKGFEHEIKAALYASVTEKLLRQLDRYRTPVMSLHLRRGDFKRGSTITSNAFFVSAVRSVRKLLAIDIPVTVFTDADTAEIADILSLPDVSVAVHKPDILDILLMSRSKVIVTSASSSFSFWAAFLSDATVMRAPNDWLATIKTPGVSNYREVPCSIADVPDETALLRALAIQFNIPEFSA